jgi:hypothetical protein
MGSVAHAASTTPHLPFTWAFPRSHAGWHLSGGVLSYGGMSYGRLVAPIRLAPNQSFAVQAQVRILGAGRLTNVLDGAGIFARSHAKEPHSDVQAGSFVDAWGNTRQDGPQLLWNGITENDATMDPGKAWHTYRLELRGAQYTFSVDGTVMARYDIPSRRNPVQVGVFSSLERVQVRSFTVTAVSGTPITTSADPPLSRMSLRLSDLPASSYFQPLMVHIDTDAEVARLRGVSAASVVASGRLVGLSSEFQAFDGTIVTAFDSVAAYTTSTAAQAAMRALVASGEAGVRANGATALDEFSTPLGDADAGFTFVAPLDPGSSGRFTVLYAVHGVYLTEVQVDAYAAGLSEADARTLVSHLAGTVLARVAKYG